MLPILARWRVGIGLAGLLAALGLVLALSHYRSAYNAEKALRQADRAAYGAAQAQAVVIAQNALHAAENRYRSKADEADREKELALADARGAATRYIAANRVRSQAVARPASGAVTPAQGGGAQGADGPGAEADMVAVKARDVEICTDNTVRLEAARAWALGL